VFFPVSCLVSYQKILRLAPEGKIPPKLFSLFQRKREIRERFLVVVVVVIKGCGYFLIVLMHLKCCT
jgi:hypothetical protein